MKTKLGTNIDAILNQLEKEQEQSEKTDNGSKITRLLPELDPNIVAKLNELDAALKPTIIGIQWWGYYSTNPTLAKEALDFYQRYWDILEPWFTRYTFMGQEEDIEPSLVPQFSLPYAEAVVSYTERWNSMTEEAKNHVIEKSHWSTEDWAANARKCQREWELAHGIRSSISQ